MIKVVLKLAVTVAIFAFILSQVDFGAVGDLVARADRSLLGLALFLSIVLAVADGLAWRSVLLALGYQISRPAALLYSFVGCFFASLGPSVMGVDIFRAAQMRRLGIPTAAAVRAVIAARLVAFVCLLALIVCGLPILFGYDLERKNEIVLLTIVVACVCALAGILLLEPARKRLSFLRESSLARRIAGVSRDLLRVLSNRDRVVPSLLHATSVHLLRVSVFIAIADAFHAGLAPAALFALVPVSMLIAMIPITIGSWGARELSFIFFLGWIGVSMPVALGISICFGVSRLIMAALGGFVWLLARSHHYDVKLSDAAD